MPRYNIKNPLEGIELARQRLKTITLTFQWQNTPRPIRDEVEDVLAILTSVSNNNKDNKP
jgi:hypothetical protein